MPNVLEPIQVTAGIKPDADHPSATTEHYIFAKGIRFVDGFPEKTGGWQSITFDNNETIDGVPRTNFSYFLSNRHRFLIGTNKKLYDIIGTQLTNITPVKTTTISVANGLDNYYATLGTDPLATTSGSTTVTVTDSAHKFAVGDTITISGVSGAVNGIPDTELNSDHFIRAVTTNTYDIFVNTAATSTGSGGGSSVVRASGIITVNKTSHGLSAGDRVKISNATAVGGITSGEINKEFIIRNVATNTFDVFTAGTSTSSVTGGGGGSAEYQEPIATGTVDRSLGLGYGSGHYGVGLYGVSKTSTATFPPRVWSHARYGTLAISCYNNDSPIYEWDGSTVEAPVAITNAPTANYVFVSNSIVVALGYDGSAIPNGIAWSDQGDRTNWTTGQAGSDTIEGASKWISQANARGTNLLWTETQVYTFRYIGGRFIWETRELDSIGIIGQNARVSANSNIYWMGNNNFYIWRGGGVEVIPSNTSTESTVLRYVFDDINFQQRDKITCWYNDEFREVWWHYPSSGSNEPNRVVRVNVDTFVWTMDEMSRSAVEYPTVVDQKPYLLNDSGVLYLHESGLNKDGEDFDWELETNFLYGGSHEIQISAIIPDMSMTGSFNMNLVTKEYPLSGNVSDQDYTITDVTDRVTVEQAGRYWKFKLSGAQIEQRIEFGQWLLEASKGSVK